MNLILLPAGLASLVFGAELLVRGASRLAAAFAISPLVIGLTVVAFGTSTAELAVSLQATLAGRPDIALGNVIGSNTFNVLFILGVSALVTPLAVSSKMVRREVPIMIATSLLMIVLGWNRWISTAEGLLLIVLGIVYIVFQIRESRRLEIAAAVTAPSSGRERAGWRSLLQVIAGLGLLVLGSHWLVGGAVIAARALGVSDLVISVTLVAAGTSLPEVATSVMASLRGERDIAVGNVVGSNVFNILWVLGPAAVAGGGIQVSAAAWRFDVPVMVAAAVACLPIFFSGYVIARWEGGLFLGYYLAYTVFVVLAASQSPGLGAFRVAMSGFVIPLTVVTLAVITLRSVRGRS